MRGKLPIFGIAAAVAAVLVTLMITAATHGLTNLVFAQGAPKFGFNLTGSEEVPPVQANATGLADISPYTIAGDSITYTVNATNIEDVTAGHIHFSKPRNEVLETGTITDDKLEGPMAGKQVSDLAFAGANGSLYMKIHTVENPNGEIRGTSSVPP